LFGGLMRACAAPFFFGCQEKSFKPAVLSMVSLEFVFSAELRKIARKRKNGYCRRLI
jgi:hypothetical protein